MLPLTEEMPSKNGVNKMTAGTSAKSEPPASSHSLTHYKVVLLATLTVGLVGLLLIVTWVFSFRGGLGWTSQPQLQFNWHVLTMTLAMVYFVAFQLMTYRALRYGQKKTLKMIHASFFVLIVFSLVIGYWSILDVHWGRPNFFSFHSWMAILTTLMYIAQGCLGCFSFLWPGIELNLRCSYMSYHVFFGLTTFVMGVATTLLGLFETIKKIPKFSGEAIMMNICGLLITVFTAMVVFLQTRPEYKRKPLPDD